MPNRIAEQNSDSVINVSNKCNEYIDEFSNENDNKNDESVEDCGYQITKSKNRTNLVIKYECEDQDDREKVAEEATMQGGCDKMRGVCDDLMGDLEENNCGNPNYANVSSDVVPGLSENRFANGNEEDVESCRSCEETHGQGSTIIIGGDPSAQEVHHSGHKYNDDDPQQLEHSVDLPHEDEQNAALASAPQSDSTKETNWHLLKNSQDDRNSAHDLLLTDQYDLRLERQTDLTHPIECDSGNRQLRQELDEINMGQDNSKGAPDRHKRSRSDHVQSNVVIPTITVADYSDTSFQDNTKADAAVGGSDSANAVTDNEVFYDTETFDIDSLHVQTFCNLEENENDDDLEYPAGESSDDRVIIEDDLDDLESDGVGAFHNFSDIPTTVIESTDINPIDNSSDINIYRSDTGDNIILSNTSSSSTISDSKHTDSPDSGIEILDDSRNNPSSFAAEHFLHINRDSEAFVRGGSTDCDENFLLQSDNEDRDYPPQHRQKYFESDKKDRPIFIDSISLPDVVVESTVCSGGAAMGNNNSIKTVENLEDHTNRYHHHNHNTPTIATDHNDNEKRDLVNQEARYSAQLEEAQKIIVSTQTKVNELQGKIDSLEKELSIKSWNVDRLQAELHAANKEDACVRRRLNLLQDEIVDIKQKYSESEYELSRRYDELKTKHTEQLDNYRHTQNLANALQTQLAFAQSDIETCRQEKQKLCEEKDAQLRNLQESLKQSQEKQKEQEEKWQKEFEVLRTQNADREEHLMVDCEWKLRTMQKTCKDKIEVAKKEKNEALEKASEISTQAAEQLEHVSHLIPLEAEIKQLRGLTNEQRESLLSMSDKMTDLRNELQAANRQVEEEIKNVRKIRMQCDNALSDKDRQMIHKIDEARGIVAVEWETRLLEEMTRLKNELEMVHAEERREALDKLQQEHIEEIKVLTHRYDANEEELRDEVEKLRKTLQEKCDQLRDLKEKTDAALLETRLHLERADSEYQIEINREIEKREMLAEQLKAEFAKERSEMEEKFRERLNHVKEEFAKELANTTEGMAHKHRKQLEQQWEKLIAEKEEALQAMESRHRIRLDEAESRIKELEIDHQRDFKEMKNNFEIERTTLETRDLQNSQEIEQLHRKCRCLTNLFEEMRMRYERREPRPEDLREIGELRERCESQERDLHALTERLREIQMERENENSIGVQHISKSATRKPPPKTIPTNCDVIYEENEERESPHKENNGIVDAVASNAYDEMDDSDEDESENQESDDENEITEEIEDVAVIAV